MSAIGAWLSKFFLEFLWGKITSFFRSLVTEWSAKREDKASADKAVDKIEAVKPDPKKTEGENNADQEKAWDDFYDTFKR